DPSPEGFVLLDRRQELASGLLQDHNGRSLLDYSMLLGCCSITRAEMGGLSKFFVDLEAGYHKFILQLDSLDAISFLTGKGDPIHQHEMEGGSISISLQKETDGDRETQV
ncbi:hypothetical protein LINPERPRIM_LOCUS30724, partial [Linum perenne]